MYKYYITTILSISLLFSNIPVFSQNIPQKPDAWVNDYANTLSESEEQMLNRKLAYYEDSTSTQIFIVLTNEHGNMPISMMGAEIGEKWEVGQKGKDNGMIILMYPQDREVTIQTGYGLEQYVPDAIAKRIIENEMKPYFREGRYAEGLDNATDVIMNLLSGNFTADQYRAQTSSSPAPFGLLLLLVLFFVIFGQSRRRRYSSVGRSLPFWLALGMMSGSRHSHGGSWGSFSSGSGGFGGFSGGGGGSFGGGGASGSW